MKLISYYILHTFINSIKKIFKSWVGIFIIICFSIGIIIGATAAIFSNINDETSSQQEIPEVVTEQIDEENKMDKADILKIIEIIAGGVVIVISLTSIATAEKAGNKIFTMPDVNFLFPSPKKPQSVLMFRLILQMGMILISSIYLLAQLPNLIFNAGLSVYNALVILFAWFVLLIIGKLISVCTYTIVATHTKLKKFIRPLIYSVIAIILLTYLLFVNVGGMDKFDAAKQMFASKNTRWVPVWGWVRGIVMYSIEGNIFASLMCLIALVLTGAIFIYIIWHIKADFYEDALTGATEIQEKTAAMTEGRAVILKRSKKIKSGEIGRGEGANAFLYKHLYNRKRSARFGFLTKTLETYLVICIAAGLFTKFSIKSESITGLSIIMIYIVFFRSFGNPIGEEASKNYLYLVPETPFKKLFNILAGGTIDSFLNILPGYFIAVIIIGGNISAAICWFILFICFDFLTTCTALITDMIIPTSVAKAVRGMLLILLNMLCIAIIGIPVALFGSFTNLTYALIFASILCVSIGIVFCFISQKLLHKGKN